MTTLRCNIIGIIFELQQQQFKELEETYYGS
jgi:hypothetical protein